MTAAQGPYRYRLSREGGLWRNYPPAVFLMLNPSTADDRVDDPTIRRCRRFALDWGCDGMRVINLYALRSTDPHGLWLHPHPVGPHNDLHIADVAAQSEVICAWGSHAKPERVAQVMAILRDVHATPLCLGLTKQGQPKHPLYLPAATGRQPFQP